MAGKMSDSVKDKVSLNFKILEIGAADTPQWSGTCPACRLSLRTQHHKTKQTPKKAKNSTDIQPKYALSLTMWTTPKGMDIYLVDCFYKQTFSHFVTTWHLYHSQYMHTCKCTKTHTCIHMHTQTPHINKCICINECTYKYTYTHTYTTHTYSFTHKGKKHTELESNIVLHILLYNAYGIENIL